MTSHRIRAFAGFTIATLTLVACAQESQPRGPAVVKATAPVGDEPAEVAGSSANDGLTNLAASPDAPTDAQLAACNPADLITGKAPNEFVGGMEGWFNSTPVAPCSQWEERTLAHPDTVLINTRDGTLVEAYGRTDTDVLDPYRDLGDDMVVPNPDATWPDNSLVLIDAGSGELLETFEILDQPLETLHD